jgi:hypothetical protein
MKLIGWKKMILLPGVSGMALGVALISGCASRPRETVVVPPPPPPVVVVQGYPDDYFWDGDEYVGFVGGQYYYLGPGEVWVVADPVRVERFRTWEREHPDWRNHAIPNEHYRSAGRENVNRENVEHQQRHDPPEKKDDHEH